MGFGQTCFLLPFLLTPSQKEIFGIGCFWRQSRFLNDIERFLLTAPETEGDCCYYITHTVSMYALFQPSVTAVYTTCPLKKSCLGMEEELHRLNPQAASCWHLLLDQWKQCLNPNSLSRMCHFPPMHLFCCVCWDVLPVIHVDSAICCISLYPERAYSEVKEAEEAVYIFRNYKEGDRKDMMKSQMFTELSGKKK